MESYFAIALVAAAGITLVIQNLLMVRITEGVSTVLITLVLNSGIGLCILLSALLAKNGLDGVSEAFGSIRLWTILPGMLGSFFVFAGIIGYQKIGATMTISILISSQLIAGLLADSLKTNGVFTRPSAASLLGIGLLIVGTCLVANGRVE